MDLERIIGDPLRWVAPVVVITALIVGATAGLGPALLVLAGGVLVGVVLLLWSSVGRLTGESPLTLEEAIGLGAPSPEEERKRSILRALKDLEYERSVGKISDEDFAELSARYRADAKTLLKLIDAESAPFRKSAEERLAARLRKDAAKAAKGRKAKDPVATVEDGAAAKDCTAAPASTSKAVQADEAVSAVGEEEESDAVTATTAGIPCPSCQTANDTDAAFCKRCGTSLGKAAGAES
jgi:hypothetical protein